MNLEQNFQQDISTKLKNIASKIDKGEIPTERIISEIYNLYVTAERNSRVFIDKENER